MSLKKKFEMWNWDDTWELLGFSMLLTIAFGTLWGLAMVLFFSGESSGYYMDSRSWWERDAKGYIVVVDSTTMQKNRITEFYVKEKLDFEDDPILLATFDSKDAQELFFKLTSQRMTQNLKTKSIAILFKELPFDEKINFLAQINMLKIGEMN